MTYQGHIENGAVLLDDGVRLPEGAKLRIEVVEEPRSATGEDEGPTLYERLKPIIGIIKDLPPDFALNHDHYIHGTPKK